METLSLTVKAYNMMKTTIRHSLIALALVALMPLSAVAQDARQRTTTTVIADVLNSMPAQTEAQYNTAMHDLAATGAEGVQQLAAMLVPAKSGKNSYIEYALFGLATYVMAPGREAERAEVRRGIAAAIDQCSDDANRAFLLTLLEKCATADDASVFLKYVQDPYLEQWAINGLAHTPGTDAVLLDLMGRNGSNSQFLAYAAGVKQLTAAEPTLIKWATDTDERTRQAALHALGICGSQESLPVLGKAAKAIDFEYDKSEATASYLRLLQALAEQKNAAAVTEAKRLTAASYPSHVRAAALRALVSAQGSDARNVVIKAISDKDRAYRVGALRLSESFADETFYATVAKKLKGKSVKPEKADILNWLGTRHVASQIDAVIANFDSPDSEIAEAAIGAAGKIGGDKALAALVAQLKGNRADAAAKALLSFNGSIDKSVVAALNADKTTQLAALKLASTRHLTAASPMVFALLNAPDADICAGAYQALPGVMAPSDFVTAAQLLEKDGGDHTAQLQTALISSIKGLDNAQKMAVAKPVIDQSRRQALYYPVLAEIGSTEAIAEILKGYNGNYKNEAFEALLKVNNPVTIGTLYEIAATEKDFSQRALKQYTTLVDKSGYNAVRKYQLYRQALELATEAEVQNRLIKLLGNTLTYQAFSVIAPYLDRSDNAAAAAEAVRTIASKTGDRIGGEAMREALEKAIKVFEGVGDADAGYAIDDIKSILQRLSTDAYVPIDGKAWNVVALNPAEKAKANAKAAKSAQALAETAAKAWQVTDGGMAYTGNGIVTMGSADEYANFELIFDWKSTGKAAVGVRSIPQIDLGGDRSGALSGNIVNSNIPKQKADNAAGEWNSATVRVVDDRVTVTVNGVVTAENVILENACDRNLAPYASGKILLISQGAPVEFRDIMVRQLPATPKFVLSKEEEREGFEVLFDGTSMHKWTGNTTDYVPADGAICVSAEYGGTGNLYTVKEYSDFVFRFEFAFLRDGVNNGVGIRTPMGVDAAYEGMEIQILDHDADIYKGLHEYQQHGSVYGVIPAKHVKFPALGTWNTEEIRAVGDHITVIVNGEVIVDGNIRKACQGHNIAPDGSDKNPYTVDKKNHPGLFNKSGHIGFLGHGAGLKIRNVRIKDMSK